MCCFDILEIVHGPSNNTAALLAFVFPFCLYTTDLSEFESVFAVLLPASFSRWEWVRMISLLSATGAMSHVRGQRRSCKTSKDVSRADTGELYRVYIASFIELHSVHIYPIIDNPFQDSSRSESKKILSLNLRSIHNRKFVGILLKLKLKVTLVLFSDTIKLNQCV